MAMFSTLGFRRGPASVLPAPGSDLPERIRLDLPMRFEAVGEALWRGAGDRGDRGTTVQTASSTDVIGACTVVGRDVARDGAALGEALSGLRSTYELVLGTPPAFEATEALSVAWSEATLAYLHDLSCEDPLTGLASLAHVRTRLDELYREADLTDVRVSGSHALVVVELSFRGPTNVPGHTFTRAMRLVQVAEALRAVWSGGQTLGRLGLDRAAAVVPRSTDLGMSVGLLRDFLSDLDLGATDVRVWIEGLPVAADSARSLLDELAR